MTGETASKPMAETPRKKPPVDTRLNPAAKREKAPLGGSALDLLEEAMHALRSAPLSAWAGYYIGALPFVLGFLYFWADMSRSAWAESHCAAAALGLALLFGWMKTWQAVFAGRLSAAIQGLTPPRIRFGQVFAVQTLVHAASFAVLPVSLGFMIPFGWCVAFFQNVTAVGSEGASLRDTCRLAWSQSLLWPGSNHLALLILFLFGLFVFVNIEVTLLFLPNLLNSLFGVETLFSRSGYYLFNTTFLVTAGGLAYLCVDPVVKAVYVLRCHHGRSIKSGQDIKSALASLVTTAAVFLALFLAIPADRTEAAPLPAGTLSTAESATAVSPEALDKAARSVLSRSEYAWRLPREKKSSIEDEERESGPFMDMMAWLNDKLSAAWDWIGEQWRKLGDWLKSLFPKKSGSTGDSADPASALSATRYMLYAGLALLAVLAIVAIWRLRKKSAADPGVQADAAAAAVPVVLDENATADQLPESGWMALARDLADKGDFRLALRAMFLATLARLAEMELIRLARHKANWEYHAELARRSPNRVRAQTCFRENLLTIDRIWYGRDAASAEDIDRFGRNQRELMNDLQALFGDALRPPVPNAPPATEFDIHA